MKKNYSFIGLILIAIGILALILKTVFDFSLLEFGANDFWVFIVLLVGLSFELGYFLTGRNPGLLVPGGIITTIALLFMFEITTNWRFAEYTWPIYILSVAIGLFQLYLFYHRPKGLLIASLIIGGVAAFFMACSLFASITSIISTSIFIPVALIAAGIALFFAGTSKKSQY